jgi:hypothetical protein
MLAQLLGIDFLEADRLSIEAEVVAQQHFECGGLN